ncbi:MAG: MATE family efflux transporter [Treponema sp.]|jgi:putative MATE family efflux protein|nr:MATE family efflux transporter [Treponema sp.]
MKPQSMAERWNNRALFALLWPLIIEQLLAVTMGAADTIMVSSVGEFAVSAVNVIDNINNFLIIAFTAMCTGGAVVASQYIGRQNHANSRIAAKQLVYIVVLISLIVMAVALVFCRPIIRLLYGKIEDDVMNAAAIYFFITALSYPFLALNNANAALFRAVGNSRVTMIIALLVNILKIGGNVLFIFVLNLGVLGAALSTLICRIIAALITTSMLYRSNSPISIAGLFNIHFVRSMIKNILNVGLPSGLESSMFMIGRILTQRIFPVFGTSAMAANAITSVINSLSFMIGTAFGIAMLTIVGQCVGAGDYAEVKKQTAKLMKMAYITLFFLSTLVFICRDPLIGLFSLSSEAHVLAKSFLQVHCISMAFGWAMSFALPNALRAAGDARYVMIAATISMWLVRVSSAYLFAFGFGLGPVGVWIAMGADFFVRGVFYCLRWLRGKWQEKRVITD